MNDEVKSRIMKGIKIALDKAKIKFLREIKQNTPVDTGFMRNNIIIEDEKSDGSFKIHSKSDYSSFIEEGTGNIIVGSVESPRTSWKAKQKRGDSGPSTMPFMRPTIYNNRKWLNKTISDCIKEEFT